MPARRVITRTLFQRDQAVTEHFVQLGEEGVDLVLFVHDFDEHGKVFARAENLRSVQLRVGTKTRLVRQHLSVRGGRRRRYCLAGPASFGSRSNQRYSTGNTIKVNNMEEINPPMTTVASGPFTRSRWTAFEWTRPRSPTRSLRLRNRLARELRQGLPHLLGFLAIEQCLARVG
jgi:hypothetical protein